LDVKSSDVKINVGFLSGTITDPVHLFWRIVTGPAGVTGSGGTLLISAVLQVGQPIIFCLALGLENSKGALVSSVKFNLSDLL
jgi:hypothetical protein